ncbi:hypothetical protein [Paraburkholderia fungorum]|jgi:hypothetical protein|uniref:hypothetical protein n=1 Tax=Paraburkholderia fungorum TaxID=134537 RepID=UPI000D07A772|nr:hypothetical protein [Paraburkholderia fungorum]PRZ45404.1 hypothetical protein BX589_13983 [Paraburkholderia fungorum]
MKITFDKPLLLETSESYEYYKFTTEQINTALDEYMAQESFKEEGICGALQFASRIKFLADFNIHSQWPSEVQKFLYKRAVELNLKPFLYAESFPESYERALNA